MSRLVLASLLAAALVACGGKSSPTPVAPLPPDEPTAEDRAPEPEPEPVAKEPEPPPEPITITVPAEPVTVKLVKKGKGKKSVLAYAHTAGAKQTFETRLAVKSTSSAPGGGQGTQSTVLPTMVLGYTAEVLEVTPEGTAKVRVVLDSVGFEEAADQTIPTEALSEAFDSLKGLTAEYTVDARGVAGDQSVTFPAGTEPDPSMTQQILPALIALPAEPIGSGATWEVSRDKISNFAADAKTVYTLKSRKGGAATVEGKTTIKGDAQQIDEGGMTIEVTKIEGSGKSSLDVTPGALVATGTLSQDVAIAMKLGDQPFETSSSTTMTTSTK